MEGCDLATKRTSIEDYRSCDLHVLPLSFMSLQKKDGTSPPYFSYVGLKSWKRF